MGGFLPFVGTLKALLTITSLTTLILLNEERTESLGRQAPRMLPETKWPPIALILARDTDRKG